MIHQSGRYSSLKPSSILLKKVSFSFRICRDSEPFHILWKVPDTADNPRMDLELNVREIEAALGLKTFSQKSASASSIVKRSAPLGDSWNLIYDIQELRRPD